MFASPSGVILSRKTAKDPTEDRDHANLRDESANERSLGSGPRDDRKCVRHVLCVRDA